MASKPERIWDSRALRPLTLQFKIDVPLSRMNTIGDLEDLRENLRQMVDDWNDRHGNDLEKEKENLLQNEPKTKESMTMKILVYYGKHGDEYWMADTPEQLEAAMRGLFASLDECDYYEDEDHAEKAREGDLETIKCIL